MSMEDVGATPDIPVPSGTPATAPPATAAPAQAAPEAPQEPDWSTWSTEDYQRHVKELRNENAKFRQRWKPYEQTFERLDPGVASQIMRFAQAVGTDNEALTEIVGDWAGQLGLTKAEQREVAGALEDAQDDGVSLTADKVKAIVSEVLQGHTQAQTEAQRRADQERANQQQADAIRARATELGYSQDEDPVAWTNLFAQAMRIRDEALRRGIVTNPLEALQQAHDALDAYRTSIVDSFRDTKTQAARRVPAPSGSGGTPTKDTTPTSLDEAHARFLARGGVTS